MVFDATFWVAISFIIFFGVLIYLKVPLKIYSTFKLTPKYKQKIIQEAQKDYSTCSSLERLARNLEFKNSVAQQKPNENS